MQVFVWKLVTVVGGMTVYIIAVVISIFLVDWGIEVLISVKKWKKVKITKQEWIDRGVKFDSLKISLLSIMSCSAKH